MLQRAIRTRVPAAVGLEKAQLAMGIGRLLGADPRHAAREPPAWFRAHDIGGSVRASSHWPMP